MTHEIILTLFCLTSGSALLLVLWTLAAMYREELSSYLDRRAKRRAQSLQTTRRLRGLRLDHTNRT